MSQKSGKSQTWPGDQFCKTLLLEHFHGRHFLATVLQCSGRAVSQWRVPSFDCEILCWDTQPHRPTTSSSTSKVLLSPLTSPWASESWFKSSFSTQHSPVFTFTQCVQLSRHSICWFSLLNVIQLLLQIKVSFVVQSKFHSVKTLAVCLSSCCSNQLGICLPSPLILAILLKPRGQPFHVLKESSIPPLGQHSAFHWAQLLTGMD